MINMLTVDVEDWQQSTLDSTLPISERARKNTDRLLDIFSKFGARATFFVQTLVAEQYPELIARIFAEGHEIASHGHGHVPLFRLSPAEFSRDLGASLEILKQLTHTAVQGYRAPDFSIRRDTSWAWDVLVQHGISYSSSIVPYRGRRYGIPDAPLGPHRIRDGLTEVPLSVVRVAGRNLPVAGGGYLRLYPYWVTRWAIRRINAEGRHAVVYLHPYELDEQELEGFRGRIAPSLYWSQSVNRRRTEQKLRRLLGEFEFAPIREVVTL